MTVENGDLVRLPGEDGYVTLVMYDRDGAQVTVAVKDSDGNRFVNLTEDQFDQLEVLKPDGNAPSGRVLAGMWSEWMGSAAATVDGAAMVSTSLTPYPHQHQAVYQRMLPQPMLRFLLGDEPGTGKTIMGGLYAREAQRLGFVKRCLIVCPAHLVTKWQADFDRFLGGGLRRIDNDTVANDVLTTGLHRGDGFWVVSLELAAVNPRVLDAIDPASAGWDLVIFDEAHRLTPTAESFHRVGRLLSEAPRALLMTATPHRGNERLFRSLMHLVDPDVFPEPVPGEEYDHQLKPGRTHFLRRLKEELYDHEEKPLFHPREAANIEVPLSAAEFPFYQRSLDLVDAYFPQDAKTLGRMVYGKRAASCLHSLRETLSRRAEGMGTLSPPEAKRDPDLGDPDGDDPAAREHAQVVYESSTASAEERRAIKELLADIDAYLHDPNHTGPSDVSAKWPRMVDQCLTPNGIEPGNGEQLVVFTEYADTADWLVDQFRAENYTAERYSGRDDHPTRDLVRDRFMAGEFQVIVSTDAGNEGIDLQSAHVLVNWDIPWSLVTLEQRMGRIHRVGQTRTVHLYSLITTGTLEGDTYAKLLERLVSASHELNGKMFDCLSLVGEQLFGGKTDVPLAQLFSDEITAERAKAAIEAITQEQLRIAAETELERENALQHGVEIEEAIRGMQDQQLEQINPYIVERYLRRMGTAGLLSVEPSALATKVGGLFNIAGTDRLELPRRLTRYKDAVNADRSVLIATLGDGKADAVREGYAAASSAVELSPSNEPFRDLIHAANAELQTDLYRGGVVRDLTSTTDYTLFAFETPVKEGKTDRRWRQLVRVDATGAYPTRFDILNNLEALDGQTHGAGPHPAAEFKATETAEQAIADRRGQREEMLNVWHEHASRDLKRLASDLTRDVPPDQRKAVRERAQQAAKVREAALRDASDLTVGDPELVGWVHVRASAPPADPTEEDSEAISMRHVAKVLSDNGWSVADVSPQNVGFDLRARKRVLERNVEVKGVWGEASSDGIRLTGGEMIRAAQLGDSYWLYVVDNCQDGVGRLAAVVRNPAVKLEGLTRDVPLMKVRGSDLMALPRDPEA